MSTRPPGLPDFKSPPVTEVVLGLQFNSAAGFLTPHLGLVWERFRSEFPHVEEQAPLTPVFEIFGQGAQPPQFLNIGFPQMPRVFFINADRSQLLQVQRDRFVHNWRKVGDTTAASYPRFERMIETFQSRFGQLEAVFKTLGLPPIVPNQCEVSYINQIEVGDGRTVFSSMRNLLGDLLGGLEDDELGNPEDANIAFRYVLRNGDQPIGRVSIHAFPARRADGVNIIQLTLTARGAPQPDDINGVRKFIEFGREKIVRAFARLTSQAMHSAWGRTQ